MRTSVLSLLGCLSLSAQSQCGPDPYDQGCLTRHHLAALTPAGAVDCGRLAATISSVGTAEFECANNAIAARRPFILRKEGVVGCVTPSADDYCRFRSATIAMLVGSLEGGAYRITEHRDGLIPPMTEVGQRVIVSTTCVPSNDARLFGLSIIEIPYITINCAAPGSPDHILARDTPSFENPICRMPQ